MKRHTFAVALAALTLSTPAMAGPIERACLNASNGTRAMCSCIQQVADMTLRGGDQRKAASFFADPDAAQEIRISKRDSDSAFWQRYRNFGNTAEAYCKG
ncbi:hypothetical protein QCN27_01795 [Cereibacter sp. SYSU M97828]|nr:hypothetical protein [Cereibacter flavus]